MMSTTFWRKAFWEGLSGYYSCTTKNCVVKRKTVKTNCVFPGILNPLLNQQQFETIITRIGWHRTEDGTDSNIVESQIKKTTDNSKYCNFVTSFPLISTSFAFSKKHETVGKSEGSEYEGTRSEHDGEREKSVDYEDRHNKASHEDSQNEDSQNEDSQKNVKVCHEDGHKDTQKNVEDRDHHKTREKTLLIIFHSRTGLAEQIAKDLQFLTWFVRKEEKGNDEGVAATTFTLSGWTTKWEIK